MHKQATKEQIGQGVVSEVVDGLKAMADSYPTLRDKRDFLRQLAAEGHTRKAVAFMERSLLLVHPRAKLLYQ